MTTMIIKGRLTDDGQIEADLPEGWQPGEVSIEIAVDTDTVWTEEELAEIEELMQPNPVSGAEIVKADEIGSWGEIEDSVQFVEEMRRKRRQD